MSCERTIERLHAGLQGTATPEARRELEAHIASCAACREEAESIAALWVDMGRIGKGRIPRERMLARFHAALAAHEELGRGSTVETLFERIWPRRPVLQAGLAAALLVFGLVLGQWLPSPRDRQLAALRDEIRMVDLALLDHQSASERLGAVELARRVRPNARLLDTLIETVRSDPSLDVRLAAVDALTESMGRPAVGAALTDALLRETAPLMQVTLARALLKGRVAGAAGAVKRLLERQDLDPSVRDYLSASLRNGNGSGAPPPRPESL